MKKESCKIRFVRIVSKNSEKRKFGILRKYNKTLGEKLGYKKIFRNNFRKLILKNPLEKLIRKRETFSVQKNRGSRTW